MYANFLFLLLVFLIPNMSAIEGSGWATSPHLAFALAHLLYLFVLGLIFLFGRLASRSFHKKQEGFLWQTNLLLIAFLSFSFFGLEVQRFFLEWTNFQFLPTCWALLLYLFGLWIFHWSSRSRRTAGRQIRFLIPFALPFLVFTLALDLLSTISPFVLIGVIFLLTAFLMVFFPAFIQLIWKCKPLEEEDPELAARLEALCQKAHFRHAGIKVWTVMNDALTAAIVGIVPRFRYIIFTKKLIGLLAPESIEAILAHEIGHSYRRHLLIYPLIILGMTIGLYVLSYFTEESLSPFLFFIIYALLIALYLRLVFGFFSRNFERQADLHVFELDIQPKHMIDALHQVAVATGNTHLVPSWHHYSIQQRIDFLQAAILDPSLISRHHRFVKNSVIFYLILLFLFCLILLVQLYET